MVHKELYDLLDVDVKATEKQIKTAFRALAVTHHPDKAGPNGKEKYQEISTAYGILSDPEKRKIYDLHGLNGLKNADSGQPKSGQTSNTFTHSTGQTFKIAPDNETFNNIFSTLFPNSYGTGNTTTTSSSEPINNYQRSKSPGVLVQQFKVDLEDIYLGCDHKFSYERQKKCVICEGTGKKSQGADRNMCSKCQLNKNSQKPVFDVSLNTCPECQEIEKKNSCTNCKGKKYSLETQIIDVYIKAGMKDGFILNYESQGHYLPSTENYGDLHLELILSNMTPYLVEGNNLKIIQKISMIEALEGFKKNVTFVDNSTIQISANPTNKTIQSGNQLVYEGKGLPVFNENEETPSKYGDLIVELLVMLPKKMTPQVKANFINLLKNC